MYEPSQHDDNVTPDNIVRSQFGAPKAGANGSTPDGARRGIVPEQYRFDPNRPRRRRYAPEQNADAGAATNGEASPEKPQQPATPTEPEATEAAPRRTNPSQWTVARPDRLKPPSKPAATPDPEPARTTRAERRRAAEADGATDEPTTRSADLNRIAAFLRSTQDIPIDTPAKKRVAPPVTPPAAPPAEEKTSELPTVVSASEDTDADKSEQVLNAVRQIPGVTGARLADSDSTLSLEIAEDADTQMVSRSVVDLLDSRLGLAAQPVSPAVGTVETEPKRERSFALPPGSRAVLERTQVITSGFESTVEVGLTVNGARAVGRSTGPAVDWHILRAAADATVDAVGVLLGRGARVVVEHAAIEKAGPSKVAVVVVLLLTEEGSERLAGAAPVDGDRRQAIVHATLQALNRRLETMLLS